MIRRIALGLTVLALVLVALYFWRYNPMALSQPKDAELVALFRSHREAFERLRTLAMQDSGTMLYFSEDSLRHSSLSEARRDEYLRLMAFDRKMTIGATAKGVTFRFATGGVGLAIARSWIKGITYLSDGADKGCTIVKSLDALRTSAPDGVYLVPIEPNWYLVFSKLD